MINAHTVALTAPSKGSANLVRGVSVLADRANATGRDAAATLLQGILRNLQAGEPARG